MDAFSVEALEEIAAQLATETATEREKLFRLNAACARILANRQAEAFLRRPCTHGDEAGHWDNSFPPEQVYSEWRGPLSIEIRDWTTEDVATSGGFYYSWRRVTSDPGLFIDKSGHFWGAEETGEGRVGQFAAHPGDTGVECSIEWRRLYGDEVSTEDLRAAFLELGKLAFPLASAAREGK